jgi:hypothetical protein
MYIVHQTGQAVRTANMEKAEQSAGEGGELARKGCILRRNAGKLYIE